MKLNAKKMLAAALALAMSLALVSCGNGGGSSSSGSGSGSGSGSDTGSGSTGGSSSVSDEAANFPEREITVVVPYDAGGASDMTSRIAATGLSEALGGATVLVENRSGGTGSVGMNYARSAAADGYTICYIPVEIVMQEILGISDIVPDDFDFIGRMTEVPAALTVPIDAPYDTVQEFIAYATEHPGEVTVGNSGTGSIWHIVATLIEQETGVQFNHIPYDSAASAVTSLMGGHIDAVTVNAGEVLSGVEAGRLKILALMTEERDEVTFSDIPTMKECGYDIVIGGWGAFAVPAGTPQAIVDKLSDALESACASQDFIDFISQNGMIVHYSNAADTRAFVDEQYTFFNDMLSNMELN